MRNPMFLFLLMMFVPARCWVVPLASHQELLSATATTQEKAEAAVPVTTLSPPEGNTTFLSGTTWCVASPGAMGANLQNALDWACGVGKTDCSPIQHGGPCFEPNTLLSHASYAFNIYYQQNGNSDIACNFGGTARIVTRNPSHGKCIFLASGLSSSASEITQHIQLGKKIRPLMVLLMSIFLS
ncbi:hypothetical protein MLD38_010123 [Melastoma candidum]|uniref:Uncharacterized protein n=1 Tax=Melastoma candidum TaxID=119954 RepID=A0ACB9QYZ9_9MYRT|nr:hypothetical protein MLD38_010123 [Melastoma candidum]